MSGFVDIYTIIFLVIAIVIFLRLRSVLGRRTGSERPPFDPYARRDMPRTPANEDKVISLPRRPPRARKGRARDRDAHRGTDQDRRPRRLDPQRGLRGPSPPPTAPSIPRPSSTGARAAYEMIVTAFAEGDRKALKQLLSREVYDGFVSAITEREARQEKIEFKFVGIDKAEITDARRSRTAPRRSPSASSPS